VTNSYRVVRKDGDPCISVTINVNEDGSLRIADVSRGSLADEIFGQGRDVESWIDIVPAEVARLAGRLLDEDSERTGDEVARRLTEQFRGDVNALNKILSLLDRLHIAYERGTWT